MSTILRPSLLALVAATGLLGILAPGRAQPHDLEQVLQGIDERSNFLGDFSATFTLVSIDPTKGEETRQARLLRDDASDRFLVLITLPETQLGQGYLNIEDGFWFYDPESRQFAFSSLSERFQGSDANHDDFGSSTFADDYDVAAAAEGTLGSFDVWVLELVARNEEVPYPFKTIWITTGQNLVLKTEDYSLNRRLLRISYYPSYVQVGDTYVADRRIFVDTLVAGKTTEITISDISTADIPDYVFTKAYVERVNR